MMNVLVLCADYPDLTGNKAMSYVHVRNKYYREHGIVPVVLNFACAECYMIDEIKVITQRQLESDLKNGVFYDCLICHAPNIRNHYRFLKKYQHKFKKIMFVFHGHEIVKITEVYPRPYWYIKQNNLIRRICQNAYDTLKLVLWRKYFPKIADKSYFIFVSKVLYEDFQHYLGAFLENYEGHVYIIPNSVGKTFAEYSYDEECDKKYDFITIRSNLDSSVYCIDIVAKLAEKFPEFSFLVIGKGNWFKYNKKPQNVLWISEVLEHSELLSYINMSKFALMPTRRDSQGVMTCELLTYGIPVITSDLVICREITNGFSDFLLIDNNVDVIDLRDIIHKYKKDGTEKQKGDKYLFSNTVEMEVELLKGQN